MQPINTLLDPIVNFGKVTVSAGYNDTATEIILATGDGSKLPDPLYDGSFNLVWYNNSTYSDPADDPYVEIVRCFNRFGDTLYLIRDVSIEGTVPSNKNLPGKIYKMIVSPTKKTITDIQSEYQSGISTGIGAHSLLTSSVHNFDSLGNAPAQIHSVSKHTGTIGDHQTNLTGTGTNTHANIDTAISASTGHIAASSAHGVVSNIVGISDIQSLTNKTITDSTNNVMARSLKSSTTTIDVSAATAPTIGQVLTATSSIAATWQSPSAIIHGNEKHTEVYITSAQAGLSANIFGDGSDGNVTISSDTTLVSDKNYNNLTINAGIGLYTNGYVVRIKNTLTCNGKIHCEGKSIGQQPMITTNSFTVHGGGYGGAGAIWGGSAAQPGESSTFGLGGNGGNGGGAGGSTGGTITNRLKIGSYLEAPILMSNLSRFFGGAGGGGGYIYSLGANGRAGGTGGGILLLYANNIIYGAGGSISANGGNGTAIGGVPGSGGGGGGFVCVIYRTGYDDTKTTVAGGAGACGGEGCGTSGTAGQKVAFMV